MANQTGVNETTTIVVSRESHRKLWEWKDDPDDTFDDALGRVLDAAESGVSNE